jgi:hypothetical protein
LEPPPAPALAAYAAAAASEVREWWVSVAALGMILLCVLVAALVVGFVTSRIASYLAARQRQREAAERGEGSYGFPVVREADVVPVAARSGPAVPVQEIGRGPGRYRIVGVVAATGTDIQMYLHAETPANAKVKAELKGVVVTDVVKE